MPFNGRGAEDGDASRDVLCASFVTPPTRFESDSAFFFFFHHSSLGQLYAMAKVPGMCLQNENASGPRWFYRYFFVGGRQKKQMMHALSNTDTSASNSLARTPPAPAPHQLPLPQAAKSFRQSASTVVYLLCP